MKKLITIPDEIAEELKTMAKKENRTLNNYITVLLIRAALKFDPTLLK